MSRLQRFMNIAAGLLIFAVAVVMCIFPKEGYTIAAAILSISLFVYAFRLMWFYFTMARHMVGGKTSLYQAVLVLDLALFTGSIAALDNYIIVIYLLGIYAFYGFVRVLRSIEAKHFGAPSWKFKLINGIVMILIAVALAVFGFVNGRTELLVYGFAASLVYSAVTRIASALRRTEMIYIQ